MFAYNVVVSCHFKVEHGFRGVFKPFRRIAAFHRVRTSVSRAERSWILHAGRFRASTE